MISTRRTDKANGPKNIPTRILEDFKKKPLSDLININFSSGIFPNSMKLAYKKGKKLDYNNCRTIYLLPNLSKIFTKLVYQRLTLFLENNNNFVNFTLASEANNLHHML